MYHHREIDSWDEFDQYLKKKQKIYIYGNGTISQYLQNKVKENDAKINEILVSTPTSAKELAVDNEKIDRSAPVLIASGIHWKREMLECLLQEGYDDVASLTDAFSTQILGEINLSRRPEKYRIMIETTSICNAKCSFCPNSTLHRPRMVMPEKIFTTILDRLEQEHISVERFILHLNGEPFTDKDLCQRIRTIKMRFPDIPIWFTTNFSLPSHEKIEEILQSGLEQVTISLNTVDAEEYSHITGGLNFQRTLDNLDYLLRRRSELGSSLHIRLSIVDTGFPEKVEAFQKRFDKLAEVRVMRMGEWMGNGLPEDMKPSVRNSHQLCSDLCEQICFLSNGDFAYCDFDAEGHVHLNVMDLPIMEAYYSPAFENLRHHQVIEGRQGTLCQNCSYFR